MYMGPKRLVPVTLANDLRYPKMKDLRNPQDLLFVDDTLLIEVSKDKWDPLRSAALSLESGVYQHYVHDDSTSARWQRCLFWTAAIGYPGGFLFLWVPENALCPLYPKVFQRLQSSLH